MTVFALVAFGAVILIVLFLCFWVPSETSGLEEPGAGDVGFSTHWKSYLVASVCVTLGLLLWRFATEQPVRLFFGDIFIYYPCLMLVSPAARRLYSSLRRFGLRSERDANR